MGTFDEPKSVIDMDDLTPSQIVFNSGGGTFDLRGTIGILNDTTPELPIPANATLIGSNQAAFVNTQLGAVQLPGSGIGFTSTIIGDVKVGSDARFEGFTINGTKLP